MALVDVQTSAGLQEAPLDGSCSIGSAEEHVAGVVRHSPWRLSLSVTLVVV